MVRLGIHFFQHPRNVATAAQIFLSPSDLIIECFSDRLNCHQEDNEYCDEALTSQFFRLGLDSPPNLAMSWMSHCCLTHMQHGSCLCHELMDSVNLYSSTRAFLLGLPTWVEVEAVADQKCEDRII